ncbi:hypothetical protein [Bermanella sp. R86510]|uniref:hypothetical protein n=1 Tax=unclassified Bermanella TaxID=2627862 RepID=UPI0037CB1F29
MIFFSKYSNHEKNCYGDLFLHIYNQVSEFKYIEDESEARRLIKSIFSESPSFSDIIKWGGFRDNLLREYLSNDIFIKDRLARSIFIDQNPIEVERYIYENYTSLDLVKDINLRIASGIKKFRHHNRSKKQIGIQYIESFNDFIKHNTSKVLDIENPDNIKSEANRVIKLLKNFIGFSSIYKNLSDSYKDQALIISIILAKVDAFCLDQFSANNRTFLSYLVWPNPDNASCELYFNKPSDPDSKHHNVNYRLLLDYFMSELWLQLSHKDRECLEIFIDSYRTEAFKLVGGEVPDNSNFIPYKKIIKSSKSIIFDVYIYLFFFREYHLYCGCRIVSEIVGKIDVNLNSSEKKELTNKYFGSLSCMDKAIERFLVSFYMNPQLKYYTLLDGDFIKNYDDDNHIVNKNICFIVAKKMLLSDIGLDIVIDTNEPRRTHNERHKRENVVKAFVRLFGDEFCDSRSVTLREFWYQRYIRYLDEYSKPKHSFWSRFKAEISLLEKLSLSIKEQVNVKHMQ